MPASHEYRAFDLFCGGGGSSLGARDAGVRPVGGVDICPVATKAFELNLPGTISYTCDVNTLSPDRVSDELGPIDLLLASPECTHHSVAKGSKPRSEESKQLAFHVIRFAKVLQPRWVVVENVIQMKSWPAFDQWSQELKDLGYHLAERKLDANDFGVAQTRRRLFIIADRVTEPPQPRTYRRKGSTVKAVIESAKRGGWSYEFSSLKNGRRAMNTIERAERAIEAVGEGQEFIMVYYGSDGAGGFQRLDRPLRTITTLDRFALVRPNCHGYEMRMLQPSELALAMGFPQNYRWPSDASRRDCIKLIGNAVCPPVTRAIVRALLRSDCDQQLQA
jgi:DNA (cytosine-5)-methyltransferase 1